MQLSSPESVGFSSERLTNITRKMQEYVDNNNAPGFTTLVSRKGKVVHFETCGYRDVEAKLPVEKDTIFRIYSMTKPITSVALMQLYEHGKFQLNDPVKNYIPAFAETKVFTGMGLAGPQLVEQETPMTIQQLLNHTSGLSYGFFYDNPIEEMYRHSAFRRHDLTLAEKVTQMAEIPLVFQPGTKWNYSIATDVCGYLVEVISGMPFEEYLQKNIFDPLGMVDTAFHVAEDKLHRFAKLYQNVAEDGSFREFKGTPHIPAQDFTKPTKSPSGGGGLTSTTEDYLKFCLMLLNKGEYNGVRIIGRKTLDYMTINHLAPELLPFSLGDSVHPGEGFGLGFSVITDPAFTSVINSVGTYEWGGAAATKFWIDPQEEIVCVLMTQLMDNHTIPFQKDFRVLTYQALID
jgi:CubicO group peptidase (beta-lactamase class C family)